MWEAKSINGGTPKFSVSLIIPKSDIRTIAKIKAAIEAATVKAKQSSKVLTQYLYPLLNPLRDGDVERPDDGTPIHILSMRIPQSLQVSWMPTATQF